MTDVIIYENDSFSSGKEALKRNEDVLKPRDPKPWQKVENMVIGEDGKPTIKKPEVKSVATTNQVSIQFSLNQVVLNQFDKNKWIYRMTKLMPMRLKNFWEKTGFRLTR